MAPESWLADQKERNAARISVILPYGGQVIFNILEADLPEAKLLISQPSVEGKCEILQYYRLFKEISFANQDGF